jgi:hypothetical protein
MCDVQVEAVCTGTSRLRRPGGSKGRGFGRRPWRRCFGGSGAEGAEGQRRAAAVGGGESAVFPLTLANFYFLASFEFFKSRENFC